MKGLNITANILGAIVRLFILGICLFAVVNVGKKAYDFGFRIFTEGPMTESGVPERDIVVSVDMGEGLRDVAKKLEEKGLTSDWMLFFAQAKLSEFKGKIDPGVYTLNTSMTTDNMMQILTKAEVTVGENGELGELSTDEFGILSANDIPGTGEMEAGSELIEGDMEAGEESYIGEGGDVELEKDGEDSSPEIDIEVGE